MLCYMRGFVLAQISIYKKIILILNSEGTEVEAKGSKKLYFLPCVADELILGKQGINTFTRRCEKVASKCDIHLNSK